MNFKVGEEVIYIGPTRPKLKLNKDQLYPVLFTSRCCQQLVSVSRLPGVMGTCDNCHNPIQIQDYVLIDAEWFVRPISNEALQHELDSIYDSVTV